MNVKDLTMNSLFDQLGLESTDIAIVDFLSIHAPLCPTVPMHESTIWNPSQAAFLRQAIKDDSDWCAMVDELDARLRKGISEPGLIHSRGVSLQRTSDSRRKL